MAARLRGRVQDEASATSRSTPETTRSRTERAVLLLRKVDVLLGRGEGRSSISFVRAWPRQMFLFSVYEMNY